MSIGLGKLVDTRENDSTGTTCESTKSVSENLQLISWEHVRYVEEFLLEGLAHFGREMESPSDLLGSERLDETVARVFDAPLEQVLKQAEYVQHEHLLLHVLYWLLGSLYLLKANGCVTSKVDDILNAVRPKLRRLILACYVPQVGGFRSSPDVSQPDTLLSTMYAVQCLALLGLGGDNHRESIIAYVCSLQDSVSGAFRSSSLASFTHEELDLRSVLCALVILCELGALPTVGSASYLSQSQLDVGPLVRWISHAQNEDGGFGCAPLNESHAGYTYCAIAALYHLKSLDVILQDPLKSKRLLWFLECRQLEDTNRPGVLVCNGRPGKPPDVCYSWWVLATLTLISQHAASLNPPFSPPDPPVSLCHAASRHVAGVLCFQLPTGGFAKYIPSSSCDTVPFLFSTFSVPSCTSTHAPDPYHTFFALAALSLLSCYDTTQPILLTPIDASTAFPKPSPSVV